MGGMQRAADKPDKSHAFPGLEIPPSIYQASKAQSEAEPEAPAKAEAPKAQAGEAPAANGLVDPMQWWGALTQQFQAIASEALKEVAKTTALDPAKNLASGMAKEAVKTATDMAKGMAETATKTMTDGARVAMSNPLAGNWSKPEAEKPSPKPAAAKTAAAKTAASKSAASKSAPKTEDNTPKTPARKTAGSAARKTTR
jgi:hypothetical protein